MQDRNACLSTHRLKAVDRLPGRRLGAHKLEKLVGTGVFGTVFYAQHEDLHQARAVKVLSPQLALDPSYVQRFQREARLAAQLRHPNIVQIYDVAEDNGFYFIAMEWIEGVSLAELLQSVGAFPVLRACGLLGQLAAALDYAHADGVVHRDLKPANVIVGTDEHLTLVDFGLARALDGSPQGWSIGMGTPEYMAPETTLRAAHEERSSDLYALGVVAFELLTGVTPFHSMALPQLMRALVEEAPPSPHALQPTLPPGIDAILLRQLAKQPSQRYPTAASFVAALAAVDGAALASPGGLPGVKRSARWSKQAFANLLAGRRRRSRLASAATVLVLLLGFVVALTFLRSDSPADAAVLQGVIIEGNAGPITPEQTPVVIAAPAPVSIQLAPFLSQPVRRRGETFYSNLIRLNFQGGRILLSGGPAPTGLFAIDDGVSLVVTRPNGTTSTWTYNFNTSCNDIVPLSPVDLTDRFLAGANTVALTLSDICGINEGTSGPILLTNLKS